MTRGNPGGQQRFDIETGRRADIDRRAALERQAVTYLANNSSNDSFFSAVQELEEMQPADESVLNVGDTISMPLPPPTAHLRV